MIDQIEDGVWVTPILKGYKLVCCDCGCTHRIDFKIAKGGDILFRAFRVGKNNENVLARGWLAVYKGSKHLLRTATGFPELCDKKKDVVSYLKKDIFGDSYEPVKVKVVEE